MIWLLDIFIVCCVLFASFTSQTIANEVLLNLNDIGKLCKQHNIYKKKKCLSFYEKKKLNIQKRSMFNFKVKNTIDNSKSVKK